MKQRLPALLLALVTLLGVAGWAAEEADRGSDLILILDASGSMWGQIDGQNKIVLAREVLGGLLDGLTEGRPVGLVVYGHRREGDCQDIEVVQSVQPLQGDALKQKVNALNPKGKTPITASLRQAIELAGQRPGAATVVLISDGLETCGLDPCAAVAEAKARGVDFLLHVVGFDVGSQELAQLQCTANAGGGLFLMADDAASLSSALDQALAQDVEAAIGRLAVEIRNNGELQDATVRVFNSADEEVAFARSYADAATNPTSIPLPDGTYRVQIAAVGIRGDRQRAFEVRLEPDETAQRSVDFSTGVLAIGATRNGEPSDVRFVVEVDSTGEQADAGRTYKGPKTNPAAVDLTAGRYRVLLRALEIEGKPEVMLEGLEVPPGGRAEIAHDFVSGGLRIGAKDAGGALVDAVVRIYADGKRVAQNRTYKQPKTNPKDFVLEPGTYRVEVKPIGGTSRSVELQVSAGTTVERVLEF